MKIYKFFLAAFLFSLLTTGIKAQTFVGGSFALELSSEKNENGNEVNAGPSTLDFNFSPAIGKFLSEKAAIGIALNLGLSRQNSNNEIESISTASSYGVSPFIRYYVPVAGKLSVFGQGNITFMYGTSKIKSGSITTNGPKNNQLSFNIFPGLSYDLSDKLSLETSINVLNFGYSHTSSTSGNNTATSSDFSIGGGIDNIVNLGNISVGAIYKF